MKTTKESHSSSVTVQMEEFSEDVLVSIFDFLDIPSSLRCEAVCKNWNYLLNVYVSHWDYLYSQSWRKQWKKPLLKMGHPAAPTTTNTHEWKEAQALVTTTTCNKNQQRTKPVLVQELKNMLRERHIMKQRVPNFQRCEVSDPIRNRLRNLNYYNIETNDSVSSNEQQCNNNIKYYCQQPKLQEVINDRMVQLHWGVRTMLNEIQTYRSSIPLQPMFTRVGQKQQPQNASLSYFEIRFVGGASIGIVAYDDNDTNRSSFPAGYSNAHIGWLQTSYGYHSDDGNFYWNDANAGNENNNDNNNTHNNDEEYRYMEYGTCFASGTTNPPPPPNDRNHSHTITPNDNNNNGDVVGCGYYHDTNMLFFTVNGSMQGIVKKKVQDSLEYYAAFSLHERGNTAQINFGSVPFVFDIEAYILYDGKTTIAEL